MSSVASAAGPIHLGMDTSKNSIVVDILMPGSEVPVIDLSTPLCARGLWWLWAGCGRFAAR